MKRSGLDSEPRLSPARRWSLPARRTLLRAVLVTALLGLAAGLLYLDPPPAAPSSCLAPSAAASQAATPSSTAGRLPVPAGLVGLPVALAEPAAAAVVHPGDRVDLVAGSGAGQPLARDALVLGAVGADPAPVLYLAMNEVQAKAVLRVGSEIRFNVIVRPA